VAVTTAACLLAACGGSPEPADNKAEPTRSPDASKSATDAARPSEPPSPSTAPEPRLAQLLGAPTGRDALTLVRQLNLVGTTLRDDAASASDVRRAGEFQQLAVRILASASDDFRRRVLARLRPGAAGHTRRDVRAARALLAMSSPQRRLPRWRIVTPPPPEELLGYYRLAQRRTGVPWSYLAAIHLVETRMGRIRGTSTAGARGPMQFLPATWELYGQGGNINRPRDAILAAARLLKRHGAPRDMSGALWHYNQSDNYVRAVIEHARAMQRSPAAYRAYWHWRVFYLHERGTYVLPEGYPENRPVLVTGSRATR
jgi:hypothetical protein